MWGIYGINANFELILAEENRRYSYLLQTLLLVEEPEIHFLACLYHMSHDMRKPLFAVSDQV